MLKKTPLNTVLLGWVGSIPFRQSKWNSPSFKRLRIYM